MLEKFLINADKAIVKINNNPVKIIIPTLGIFNKLRPKVSITNILIDNQHDTIAILKIFSTNLILFPPS